MMTMTMKGDLMQSLVQLQLHSPLSLLHQSPHSSVFHLNRQFRHVSPPTSVQGSSLRVAFGQPRRRRSFGASSVGKEEAELSISTDTVQAQDEISDSKDLEYVRQIQRVLELLKKNRDMLYSEVRLTVMIEDPREVERRRLLGIEDPDAPTREDLVDVLDQVNEGKVPENRLALQMLAEEMAQWPNLEVEAPKKKPSKSLYAKATDTGVDLNMAAKRLNIDWDSAADIDDSDVNDETEVPPAVGYGALYLVTAFPIIIGISVVLILFYNSLQ
ncbi:hypothetical protein SAY87_002435 [Trapa incisa]|uniref:Ycf3-interacting protein 1, chloroplastic n=2 Tax=Trapa TaxID=22665 RepID=A0AAN7QI83_TRANT|nr:hypothetical protein SAY87_002435 [Trapa incisa]KAK4765785.1 hypothetical protein SAY86_026875 [Trapa natans]